MEEQARPIGEWLVKFGVLDAEKLNRALARQAELKGQGRNLLIGHVVLQMGMATPQQVAKVLAHGTAAPLRCPTCRRRFTVPDFQANRRYKCAPCMAYLEVVPEAVLPPPEPAEPAMAPAVMTAVPSKPDPFSGKQLGKYRLLRKLAKGGMGVVYLGEDVETGKKYAVKLLTEEYSRMPGIQARFKREGEAGGRLEHPNIADIVGWGLQDQITFIATEYIDGGSLEQLILKEKKLPPERAVGLICDVLAALQHAHERGVVHRDIKPANVLLSSDGRAKVIDFGLAMDAEAQTILTMAGNVMGTPSYMSPEQARGERGGPLSDLYACGILLFLMLAGRKPFEGRSILDILDKQLNLPLPSIRALNPDVPEAIERVMKKMAAKAPENRYASPAKAIDALQRALKGLPEKEIAPPKRTAPTRTSAESSGETRRFPDWAWVAIVFGMIALAVAVVWFFRR